MVVSTPPGTTGQPGLTSCARVTPANPTASAATMVPAMVTGAVAPDMGMGLKSMGSPARAITSSLPATS